jgi:hypothetical protein
MKRLITILFLFISLYGYSYEIIVYGVNNCGITTSLRNELTAKNIQFTYCDVNGNQCMNDMVKVALDDSLAIEGTIYFPIVKVVSDGKITGLCRPSVADIIKLIGTTNIQEVNNRVFYSDGIIQVPVGKEIDLYSITGIKILHSDNNWININSLPKGLYIINKTKIVK